MVRFLQSSAYMKTTPLPLRALMNRSPLRAFLHIALALGWIALSPHARAVCQEGCDVSSENTFLGDSALVSNTTGNDNTASGFEALTNNTIGNDNTATGFEALSNNTTGSGNTANGFQALFNNTAGNNTASGNQALFSNTTGNNNIAVGFQAGLNLTTGNNNIDVGNAGVAGESRRIRIGTAGTQTKTFIAGIRGVTTVNANA